MAKARDLVRTSCHHRVTLEACLLAFCVPNAAPRQLSDMRLLQANDVCHLHSACGGLEGAFQEFCSGSSLKVRVLRFAAKQGNVLQG